MDDYIQLPRSALSDEFRRDPNLARLLLHLLWKTDKKGAVSVDTTELCKVYGWSRQQSRTLLAKIKTITGVTARSTAKTTTLIFDIQEYKPSHQPHSQPHDQPLKYNQNSTPRLNLELPKHSFVSPEFEESFNEWLDYKKRQFKFEYKTERSLKAAYSELVKLSGGDPTVAAKIVDQSMGNGWKGLFELKNHGTKTNTANKYDPRRGTDVGNFSESDYGGPF